MNTAFLNFRRPAPAAVVPNKGQGDLVRLFGLDRIQPRPHRLICHWQPGPDGRLVAVWEPDVVSPPYR
jgi:hypothetical protein